MRYDNSEACIARKRERFQSKIDKRNARKIPHPVWSIFPQHFGDCRWVLWSRYTRVWGGREGWDEGWQVMFNDTAGRARWFWQHDVFCAFIVTVVSVGVWVVFG